MISFLVAWCFLAAILIGAAVGNRSTGPDKSLVSDLLNGYEIDSRPHTDDSQAIQVNISYSMNRILDLDQEKQVIDLIGMVGLEWMDKKLAWDPEEFEGLTSVVISPDRVWTPDVQLHEILKPPSLLFESRLRVTSSGHVSWVRQYRYDVYCKTQPSDTTPTCNLRFRSSSFDRNTLKLSSAKSEIYAKSYIRMVGNRAWEFYRSKVVPRAQQSNLFLSSDVEFDEVTYEFKLRKLMPPSKSKDDEEDNGALLRLPSTSLVLLSLLSLFLCR